MSASSTFSYDIFPYESNPFAQTHPDRLATVATLLGLKPPPVTKCRMLEIGCSNGGNLIPMAVALPGSTFLGIDFSVREIEDGLAALGKLGLPNVELRHVGIEEFAAERAGKPHAEREGYVFDYIICHGVYSWVPPGVQEKILDICRHCLSPGGIAYVSYNIYPGWHLRGMNHGVVRRRRGSANGRAGAACAADGVAAERPGPSNPPRPRVCRYATPLLPHLRWTAFKERHRQGLWHFDNLARSTGRENPNHDRRVVTNRLATVTCGNRSR